MPAFFIRAFGTANKKAGIFFPVMGRNVEKKMATSCTLQAASKGNKA
jgi:hypothetical protein